MRLGKYGKILHLDRVTLGKGTITRFTIFEIKFLFGIIVNIFNTKEQDRFHTHAFPAISVMLRGWYNEEYLDEDGHVHFVWMNAFDVRYIPRSYNHRIGKSSRNAISVTFMGPWKTYWTETFLNTKKVLSYTWGRERVKKLDRDYAPHIEYDGAAIRLKNSYINSPEYQAKLRKKHKEVTEEMKRTKGDWSKK